MKHKIILCGGSDAGKSTLGRCLSEKIGCRFMDIEDCCSKRSWNTPVERSGQEKKRKTFCPPTLRDAAALSPQR